MGNIKTTGQPRENGDFIQNNDETNSNDMEDMDKKILCDFDILSKIGKGAFGVVWKVRRKSDNQIMALKRLFINGNEADIKRSMRELEFLIQTSNHPNIVALHNAWVSENRKDIFQLFNYIEFDLLSCIKASILKPEHMAYITYQLLHALKYIHSKRIVHRDLKTPNILVNEDCFCWLVDFSSARRLGDLDEYKSGVVLTDYVATRWYRCPEILLGSVNYDVGVDIWGLGCILAEMHLGKPLFAGISTMNQLDKIAEVIRITDEDISAVDHPFASVMLESVYRNQDPEFNAENYFIKKKIPTEAANFLSKCLEFNPEKRWSAEKLLKHPYIKRFINFYTSVTPPEISPERVVDLSETDPLLIQMFESYKILSEQYELERKDKHKEIVKQIQSMEKGNISVREFFEQQEKAQLKLKKQERTNTIISQLKKSPPLKLSLKYELPGYLPLEICSLDTIQELYLVSNHLSEIPNEIGNLVNLVELGLMGNSLSTLPEGICKLTKLCKLNLSCNCISSLPKNISKLNNLKHLSLASNNIQNIPPPVYELISLQELLVEDNNLLSLDPQISQLTDLNELNLSLNQIKGFPCLTALQNLNILKLSENELLTIPPEIFTLTSLVSLSLNGNLLLSVPYEINQLVKLRHLVLTSNNLSRFPNLEKLSNLSQISLESNSIKLIPNNIDTLFPFLTELHVNYNKIKRIPSCLGNLVLFRDLWIIGNQVRKIPKALEKISKIRISPKDDYLSVVEINPNSPVNQDDKFPHNQINCINSTIPSLKELAAKYIKKNKIPSNFLPNELKSFLKKLTKCEICKQPLNQIYWQYHYEMKINDYRLGMILRACNEEHVQTIKNSYTN